MEFAIETQDLGVEYSLRFTKKTSIRRSFQGLLRREGPKKFWALRNVSMRLEPGQALGVIGPNGAGKSTLLQVLAGIIQPSEGLVTVNGQVSTLLQLQAGFDYDLSGRENILLAGELMGIDYDLLMSRVDSIIEFADIGQFINANLRTYSSGMRAKLGFSIATAFDPDILLLDEVLQTGDEAFREKSYERVRQILASATAVVMVSHDLTWITEFCNRAMLFEQGHIVADGTPEEVVALHVHHSEIRKAEQARIIADMKAGKIPPRRKLFRQGR